MFENMTFPAPNTQSVSIEVFPNGGGPPLPVIYAGPVTTNPPLTGGLNVGQLVAQARKYFTAEDRMLPQVPPRS